MEDKDINFELDIEDLDGWIEHDEFDGWNEAEVDEEMINMMEDMEESRQHYEERQLEHLEEEQNRLEQEYELRKYLKESRNPNTVKKTNGVIIKFM